MKIPEYPGSCDQEGHEDCILVEAVHHNVTISYDPMSGSPTGRRVHTPLRITKFIDKSSPGLLRAMTTSQRLATVTLDFNRIHPTGFEENYYRITMTNAVIVDVTLDVPYCLDPKNESWGHMETVAFVYEQIEWDWIPDSVMEMDEWMAPR